MDLEDLSVPLVAPPAEVRDKMVEEFPDRNPEFGVVERRML